MSYGDLVPRLLGAPGSGIFALLRKPAKDARNCVLVVAPFADEMNKSRKMITDVANELAALGTGTLVVDPFGTGDSDGEFEHATWKRWQEDLRVAAAWAATEGLIIDRLLGIRLGSVLGAQVASGLGSGMRRTVFWQPVLDGTRFVDQFLRLRVAASMMEADSKETTAQLRSRLAAGESLEVAGYCLSGGLVAAIDSLRLDNHIGAHLGDVHWMEVVRSAETPLPTPSQKVIDKARAAGANVTVQPIAGEPFWSSVEIVRIPALISATVTALSTAS